MPSHDEPAQAKPAFATEIALALTKLYLNLSYPDAKHNTGRALAAAYAADELERIAAGLSAKAWREVDEITGPAKDLPTGDHTLVESPHFACTLRVSQPVRRFDTDALANMLFAKYKVPHHTTKELIEQAKLPTQPTRTFKIIERGLA